MGLFFWPTSQTKKPRKPLSVCSKLCYAVGGAPYQITGSALGFFLQIFLLDVAQVRREFEPTPSEPQDKRINAKTKRKKHSKNNLTDHTQIGKIKQSI